jgi:hypothetical protein
MRFLAKEKEVFLLLYRTFDLHIGQPVPLDLSFGVDSHSCPFLHFHQTFLPDPPNTSVGFNAPFFS